MAGQPKTPFYVVLVIVVLGLVAFAVFRADIIAPQARKPETGKIDPSQLGQKPAGQPSGQKAESPDAAAPPITTVKEYSFKPAERLPAIKGTSAYKPMENNTVRFALNVWAGWGPIILANNGFKPGKVWKTPDGEEFRVELVLIDDPAAMIAAYACRPGPHRLGHARHGAAVRRRHGRPDGQAQGQPRDAPHLPADRLVQRRRRHRGPRGHQDRGRPARQEARAGAELALAVFRPEHAGGRRRAALGSEHDLHEHGLRGGRGLRRQQGHRRRRLLVARHLQPGQGQGQPHAGQHADGQQADRRRLVRPGRLRQRPSRHHRGPGPRHLRRHGRAEEARPEGRPAAS